MSHVLCTIPAQTTDTRYVYGRDCTWHGAIADAGKRRDNRPCCPNCGGELDELGNETEFDMGLEGAERVRRGAKDMLAWGKGRCFPDVDTLENAYRQAMEGL